jgi:ferrous iron transport protein B
MEEERGLDRAAAIADMRFSFIDKLVKETVVKPSESKERERSEKIDKILTKSQLFSKLLKTFNFSFSKINI